MPSLSRWLLISLGTLLLLTLSLVKVEALQLFNRSIAVSSAQPSTNSSHTFTFTYPSTTNVGSVVLEYCDSPVFDYPCTAPAGIDVSSASILSQSGNTGFSIDAGNTTSNKVVLTRTPAAINAVSSVYSFGNITNPSTQNQTVFIRISSYGSVDGTGSMIDNGAVAYAVSVPFNIGADVPTFLSLCVAINVSVNCTSSTGDRLNLGTLPSTSAKAGISQFAVGTNSISGYIVYIQGTTLTSGNNAINAISSPSPSFPGNNQFGINLRNNSIPNVGTDPIGSGSGTPTTDYNNPNLFKYQNGDAVAQSTLPSDYNRMTVSYMVNRKTSQSPGVYSSTFTYVATANF